MPVELYRWQATRPAISIPGLRRLLPRRRVSNFGDELGPIVVRGLLSKLGLLAPEQSPASGRLVSVGSVMHFLRPGDDVWGAGINWKIPEPVRVRPGDVNIHAVRGPRTKLELERLGFDVPEAMGDPALLVCDVDQRFDLDSEHKSRGMVLVPNLNDLGTFSRHPDCVSPLQPPEDVARAIAASEFVVASSLHAIVLADALGVSSRLMRSSTEHLLKYADYFEGTDRELPAVARDVDEAIRLGPAERLHGNRSALKAAFPAKLFASA